MSTWFGGRARKSSLSRATRGSSGKGKPRLVSLLGIASSCALPTSSAGYWLPLFTCRFVSTSASDATISIGGEFFVSIQQSADPSGGAAFCQRTTSQAAQYSSSPALCQGTKCQGTTSVVPKTHAKRSVGFSPCALVHLETPPIPHRARLQSCRKGPGRESYLRHRGSLSGTYLHYAAS